MHFILIINTALRSFKLIRIYSGWSLTVLDYDFFCRSKYLILISCDDFFQKRIAFVTIQERIANEYTIR